MVTICIASLKFNNSTFCPHSVFMCFVWISEQTAIISLYNINWLVWITQIWPFIAQWSLYLPPVYHSTILSSAHKVYLCVLCGSQNKQPLFPYTTLTDWFVLHRFNPLQPSGHYMYRQFNIQQFYVVPIHCMCFVWISEQTAIISLYSINWLVFIREI